MTGVSPSADEGQRKNGRSTQDFNLAIKLWNAATVCKYWTREHLAKENEHCRKACLVDGSNMQNNNKICYRNN